MEEKKLVALKKYLQELGTAAVAFSGGVDSTFLLKTAHEVLGDCCIAVTAYSEYFPEWESEEAREFCQKEGIRQILLKTREMEDEEFCKNPKNRCYICKKALFGELKEVALKEGMDHVIEGSNMDDLGDYRPGLQAIRELGIKSPLRECELTKAEIRKLSQEMGLPTWKKPSYACLASRFAYGERITREKLTMVEKSEKLLMNLGFEQMRVRIHGQMARIEVPENEISRLVQPDIRKRITEELKGYGFSYVTMDLQGFRSGSMNEVI
ncbi:MAG: ATP-dependent sacrificial sulfur transferase LarE [Muricoprocola sp.]